MLAIEGLDVAFAGAEAPALDQVDLEVGDGEVVALLGPSGCGKTTLLRVVAGLQAPSAGRVVLAGRDLAPVPTHERGIGLMFQDYALFPHLDVAGNVGFGLRMRGDRPAERDRRMLEVLDLVGLVGFGSRAVSTLSGGQRQRVALARALAPSPALLMLDEPLGALDRSHRDELVRELSTLFGELGLTVVYVTHDQSEALALADRVVIMHSGRIAREGTPSDVWQRPGSAFVARFLGFTNIVEVPVADGVAAAPWGPVEVGPAVGPRATLLVRPEAVRLVDPAAVGAAPATMGRELFRGDRSRVSVVLDGGCILDIDVGPEGGRAVRAGGRVGVVVEAFEVVAPT
jgi:thiamine transport system ATP-binding protein